MSEASADLARSITRAGSKQTEYTARLMVDRDLVSDFCRAYAYFRWFDDTVDASSQTRDGRVSFVRPAGRREASFSGLAWNPPPEDFERDPGSPGTQASRRFVIARSLGPSAKTQANGISM